MTDPRYARQVTLIGPPAQEKIERAHVAVLGAGGLGSPALLYLAAAGVGHITLIDDDLVDLTNLHRQVIHTSASVGEAKTDSARASLAKLNPHVRVDALCERLTWDNAGDLLAGADMLLDGTDNFATRHIASYAAARLGVPHIWASILGFESQLSVFWAGHGPVYEDLFPTPPAPGSVPSCSQAGVLGPVVGVTGSAMAMEALKLITGIGEPLVGTLAYYDSLSATWEHVPVVGDPTVTERVHGAAPPTGVAEVDEIAAHAIIIDVRERDEFARFHLTGSRNVPLGEILAGHTPPELNGTLAHGAVVVCAHGVRSAQAADVLSSRGIKGVVSLRGGLERYRTRAGHAVENTEQR